jgi:hypothetical protein
MGTGINRYRKGWGPWMTLTFLTLVLLVGSSTFTVARLLFDEWQARRPGRRGS